MSNINGPHIIRMLVGLALCTVSIISFANADSTMATLGLFFEW
jgi:hypothetical protein